MLAGLRRCPPSCVATERPPPPALGPFWLMMGALSSLALLIFVAGGKGEEKAHTAAMAVPVVVAALPECVQCKHARMPSEAATPPLADLAVRSTRAALCQAPADAKVSEERVYLVAPSSPTGPELVACIEQHHPPMMLDSHGRPFDASPRHRCACLCAWAWGVCRACTCRTDGTWGTHPTLRTNESRQPMHGSLTIGA